MKVNLLTSEQHPAGGLVPSRGSRGIWGDSCNLSPLEIHGFPSSMMKRFRARGGGHGQSFGGAEEQEVRQGEGAGWNEPGSSRNVLLRPAHDRDGGGWGASEDCYDAHDVAHGGVGGWGSGGAGGAGGVSRKVLASNLQFFSSSHRRSAAENPEEEEEEVSGGTPPLALLSASRKQAGKRPKSDLSPSTEQSQGGEREWKAPHVGGEVWGQGAGGAGEQVRRQHQEEAAAAGLHRMEEDVRAVRAREKCKEEEGLRREEALEQRIKYLEQVLCPPPLNQVSLSWDHFSLPL